VVGAGGRHPLRRLANVYVDSIVVNDYITGHDTEMDHG
jgi:hypothetical protein